jgi:hypothetical protein
MPWLVFPLRWCCGASFVRWAKTRNKTRKISQQEQNGSIRQSGIDPLRPCRHRATLAPNWSMQPPVGIAGEGRSPLAPIPSLSAARYQLATFTVFGRVARCGDTQSSSRPDTNNDFLLMFGSQEWRILSTTKLTKTVFF